MKTRPPDFTKEWLETVLRYDPEDGSFTWLVNRGRAVSMSSAGSVDRHGHIQIMVNKRLYLAHRLAWFISFGVWPDHEIDHRNGQRGDNRLNNIRAATRNENQHNRGIGKNNKSGFLGVYAEGSKWVAQIKSDGRQTRLGTFPTAELASAAYLAAKAIGHPFQPVPRAYQAANNNNQPQEQAA